MNNQLHSSGEHLVEDRFDKASLCVVRGAFAEAQVLYRDILLMYPDNPRALHALGVVIHRGGGNSEEAVCLVRRAIDLKPDYLDARCNLGQMLNELRRFSEAEECYKAALALNPDASIAWQGLGNICCQKQCFVEALFYYEKAVECSPSAEIYVQIGTLYKILERFENAATAYRRALVVKYDCAEAYCGLASVYEACANLVAAGEYAQQALKLLPSSAVCMQAMAGIYRESGRADEAVEWYQRAVDAGGGRVAFSEMLLAMNYSQHYLPDEFLTESCRWERVTAVQQEQYSFLRRSPGRLRIGYVSPDFKQHPVAFFIEPLLMAHNRRRFEIHCYSNVQVPDDVTARLKGYVENWHDIRSLSDVEAVDRIRDDRIDILVDLTGHMADNRLGIFARRAAPVQMTWLGYPNSTGVSAIDYRITDAVADPEGVSESQHSERLIRLPDGFLCYQPPDDSPDVTPPPALLNSFVTFGSFNYPAKITPEVIALWSRILLAVPNSRLLLKSKSFCDPAFADSFSESFSAHGLSAGRIMCVPATETILDHLAIYNQIDIALDPFPYNGTTTTFEALYMGVPVLALRGNRHAARVGASILIRLGLTELIADTADDYFALAVSLSRDLSRLSKYHGDLRSLLVSSALVDAVRFADSLEEAYRTAWHTFSHAHPASPPSLEEHFHQARKYFMQGEYALSRNLYKELLAVQPDNPRALHGMGVVCHRLGDSETAIMNISRAVQLYANYPIALTSLANVYRETGRVRESIEYFQQALAADPGFIEIHSNILMNMQYLPAYSRDEIFTEARRWSDYHAVRPFEEPPNKIVAHDVIGKIRIGFVSADFKKHPVGFIIIPFLSGYDRQSIDLFCYSNSSESDEITDQIVSLVDGWRVIEGLTDRAAWRIIHADNIDILVDLSGHTAGNRLVLFSMRPAPVQISWLGYFDTTGLEAIDYLIMDRFTVPAEEDHWFTEKLVYLPDSRFCYAPPEYAPVIGNPPVLEQGFVTFGSFNNLAKLTEGVICVWAKILQQVQGSRLIIKWKGCCDVSLISRYQDLFRKNGIEPDGRVEFRGESGHQEMLRQYGDVDIVLDPFPFSGGLSSLEALWMGVPIITLKGYRPVSRQTASFLEILKHGELVADSVGQYCEYAVNLAKDIENLSDLRGRLREEMRRSPLCNAAAFALNLSGIFKNIMLSHQRLHESATVLSGVQEGELDRRCNEAAQLVEVGKLAEAEACYESVLADVKRYPRALHALGVVRYRRGDSENGIELVRNALEIKPDLVAALLHLGKMLHEQGDFAEASDCYRRAVDIRPDDQNSLFLMALLLYKAGEREKAIAAYQRLVTIAPEHFDAIFNLGQVLLEERRFEDADELLQSAHRLEPNNDGLLITLGNLALNRRDFAEAEKQYLAACNINPQSAEAHTNLGHLYTDQHIELAISHCRMSVELKPDFALAWVNLGVAFDRGMRHSEAVSAYRTALVLDPKLSGAHSNLIMLMNYMSEYSQYDIFNESIAWNEAFATGFNINLNRGGHRDRGRRKIRVGIVSADFKFHPVSYHFLPVVENYDSSAFEFICYSNSDVYDELSMRIKGSVDVWRDICALSDDCVADLIRQDQIDILVDLSGHSAGNRLLVFARKPALIQVSWLGYFNTTGLSSIDYLISDDITIPSGEEAYFSEKVLRLPCTRFCYAAPLEAPPVDDLSVTEQSGVITFASFNNAAKISLECIELWASVLAVVPNSRLILKWASYQDDGVRNRIVCAFGEHGIRLDQLEFRGMSPRGEMLAQYAMVDICLDTYPFCGGATTCDALWMGVPVVTLSGPTPISRQSASFLACIGHPELVADSPDSYLQIIKNLAFDSAQRRTLRRSLRIDMSSSLLCDGAAFTRNLEVLFKRMIDEIQTGFVDRQDPVLENCNDDFSQGLAMLTSRDFVSAAESFERIVTQFPDNADAHNNLGITYFEMGFREDAKDEFKVATKISPNHADAWKNLGKAIRDTGGGAEQAARCFRKALTIAPDFDDAWMMLGTTFLDRGRSAESVKCFKKSLELNPDNCDAHSNLLFAMNYIPQYSQTDVFQESLKWNEFHAAEVSPMQHRIWSDRQQSDRLRIGYISGDFKRHPVGYHLLPVLAAHDRERFEVFCYTTMHEQDDLTEKMQGYIDGWRDISRLSDDDAAMLICGDHIDILVDLSGHTGGHRLLLFARRPAPVQVSWLGYFNTTGVKAIDYLISDETTISIEEEQLFSEQIIRLPGSRFCYAPPEYTPAVTAPPVMINGFITFGSFNNTAKLTPDVIELWSRLLIAVPDSRLILKWSTLGRKKERDRLLQQFARHGVEGERIILRGKSPHVDMLREYGDIDIALDPFPFSGGMTSCEALWMGVPVLTLLVDKPAGRQTASFLRTIGLPEWVTMTLEQYVSFAQKVVSDLGLLKSIRFGLRERMSISTLCDGVSFTRNLEYLYYRIIGEQIALQDTLIEPQPDDFFSSSEDECIDAQLIAAKHYNAGVDQMEAGKVDEAVRLFELAVSFDPHFACAYNNLGILNMQFFRVIEAEKAFRSAVIADSFFAEAHYNLGLVYEKERRLHDAFECFDSAIKLNAEYGEAYLEKGNVLLSLGDPYQALKCYENAASFLSESAVTSNNIGTVYLQLEDKQQAELFLCEALLYDPEYAPAYINLSTLVCDMGHVSKAERVASAGLDYYPDDTRLLCSHAKAMLAQCKIPEALQDLRRALELDPHDASLHSNLLFALQYSDGISLEDILAEHKLWSDYHVPSDTLLRKFPNSPDPDRKLVIGYVSPDLGRHPVGYFLLPVLSAHNRENFKVICYSDRKKTDDQTLMLESCADIWHDTSSCTDQDLLELIASDGVDVLVDLAGHTAGNRLTLFARKAAPIQVSWAGYVGTTGLSTMDYLISDSSESPEYADEITVEKIMRLPECYVCFAPPNYAPEIESLPALSNGYVTFGCFNNLAKVNEKVVKLWSELLLRRADSRILLKTKSLNDQETRERYLQMFVGYGVLPERVILEEDSCHADLLAAYNRVDIALDPFPYSGGLTTLESLWMGVPVVTLGGDRFCSRHSLSHLSALGLMEVVSDDAAEYLSAALMLSDNLETLSALRLSLRSRLAASSLCDGDKFTKNLESAYRVMWKTWVSR